LAPTAKTESRGRPREEESRGKVGNRETKITPSYPSGESQIQGGKHSKVITPRPKERETTFIAGNAEKPGTNLPKTKPRRASTTGEYLKGDGGKRRRQKTKKGGRRGNKSAGQSLAVQKGAPPKEFGAARETPTELRTHHSFVSLFLLITSESGVWGACQSPDEKKVKTKTRSSKPGQGGSATRKKEGRKRTVFQKLGGGALGRE